MSSPDASNPRELPVGGTFILLALTAGLLLFRAGDVPLLGQDEPRYARVAVEMGRSGDWVTPRLQGRPWLEKPPLYYWLAAAGYRVWGENEMAARLPSVASAVLLVGATALFGARLYGAAAGLHAGFVLATSVLVFVYGQAASMDMLLAAGTTVGIGLLALGQLGIAGRLATVAAWGALGGATLAKGPLGFVLAALVLVTYHGVTRDGAGLRRAFPPLGLALFAAVAAPWYLLVYRAQGQEFVDVFILNHNVSRFTSTIHSHEGEPYYYLPALLLGLFPWSGVILPAVTRLFHGRTRADVFVLAWLLAPLVFFSAAGSKLPGYILPCLPPLALLMGRAIAEGPAASPRAWWWGGRAGLALSAVAAAAPAWLAREGEPGWRALVPPVLWAVTVAFLFVRRLAASPAAAFALLRVGAAGWLLLLTLAAPDIVARRESGRDLFLPARGREVLAWRARRIAWMAGYFYNDGRVREVAHLAEIETAVGDGSGLVICGPLDRRMVEGRFETTWLAGGPRGNVLLEVRRR